MCKCFYTEFCYSSETSSSEGERGGELYGVNLPVQIAVLDYLAHAHRQTRKLRNNWSLTSGGVEEAGIVTTHPIGSDVGEIVLQSYTRKSFLFS